MRRISLTAAALALACGLSTLAWSQGRGAQNQQAQQSGRGAARGAASTAPAQGSGGATEFYNYDTSAAAGRPIADQAPAETHQKITVAGQPLAYTTRAGYLPLRNATTGQSEAHLFYTSYSKEGVSDASTRPILFFLGGAPGVAAAWQEFGGLGPKRVKWGAEGEGAATWVENPGTLLGQADMVFVNPVGTAFSRADQPSHAPNFWTTAADTASLSEFVRSYLAANNRRTSPLYLAAEDAGTARAASMATYLHEHQVPVRGVVLFSMTMSADSQAGDAQHLTLLPSLVMSAWFHKKLAPELNAMSAEQIAGQARQFASREYLHALYKGDRMTAEERNKALANLSRFTGLSKQFLVSNDMRVTLDRFENGLMLEQHLGLARSDARVTAFVPPAAGGRGGGGGRGAVAIPAAPPPDFHLTNLAGPFLNAYETYLRRELNFEGNSDGVFYLTTGGVRDFTSTGNDDALLVNAFARNPKLRLFVAINYFDLNSPFYATEYTLAHLNVSPEVRAKNITIGHFEAGQMTYADNKSLLQLQKELAGFLGETR